MNHPTRRAALALCIVSLCGITASAGPLTPPPGPVAPTPGPEPRKVVNATNTPAAGFDLYRITEPGSYYLNANINITGPFWGIAIEAPGVTLDLNGFTITGAGLGIPTGGIRVTQPGAVIRNGTIRNVFFGGIASDSPTTGSPGAIIEQVRVLDVTGPGGPGGGASGSGAGIFAGRGAIVRDCYVSNAPTGIAAGFHSNVSGCTVEFARQFGIKVEGGANVSGCVVAGTAGGPADGHAFVLGVGSSVKDCVARTNTGAGFVDLGDTAFADCRSTNNGGAGFIAANNSSFEGCHAVSNGGAGFVGEINFRLEVCHAARNNGPGVEISSASDWEISRCSFIRNFGGGVIASGVALRGRIQDCSIRGDSVVVPDSIGIKVPKGCEDIIITNCAFSQFSVAVELDGRFSRVTSNAFNFFNTAEPVLKADGSVPDSSNIIGPYVLSFSAGTATNPFANTLQR
ncbi:MAG: right-handed parallel beta-helix repeat-containing protein [Phycisphaerales bacterium]